MALGSGGMAKSKRDAKFRIEMSPMIDCVFQLLIFFIVTLQMDPSLDDVLRLPDAYKSARQEELNMQLYVLSPTLKPGGELDPNYPGLIAFTGRGDKDSMFVHLDDVPFLIDDERERKSKELLRHLNSQRKRMGRPPYNKEQEDSVKANMSLLIKADKNVFYSRVLQVVDKAKEAGVFTFAFVTDVKSSQLSEKK